MQKFVRVRELARIIGVHESTIWRWAAEGKIPRPMKLSQGISIWDLDEILTLLIKTS